MTTNEDYSFAAEIGALCDEIDENEAEFAQLSAAIDEMLAELRIKELTARITENWDPAFEYGREVDRLIKHETELVAYRRRLHNELASFASVALTQPQRQQPAPFIH